MSKSTLSLGGSVQSACEAIMADWSTHGSAVRVAPVAETKAAAPIQQPTASNAPVAPLTGKILVASNPDGADIEVDGSFIGNTPSDVQVPEGDHLIAVKKEGFKTWERKLKVTAGSSVHLSATLEKSETP